MSHVHLRYLSRLSSIHTDNPIEILLTPQLPPTSPIPWLILVTIVHIHITTSPLPLNPTITPYTIWLVIFLNKHMMCLQIPPPLTSTNQTALFFLPHSYFNSTIPPFHDHIYSVHSVHTCTLGSPTTQSPHDSIDTPYPAHMTHSDTHNDGVDTNIPIP